MDDLGWKMIPGKPSPELKTNSKRMATTTCTKPGGFAFLTKTVSAIKPCVDVLAEELLDTGRWVEIAYPIQGTHAF